MNQKKLLILGAGGHGVVPLLQVAKHYQTSIYYIPGDWGGSTGMIGRLFEHNDYEFFRNHKSIYNFKEKYFLPSADLSKTAMAYSEDPAWMYQGTHILDYRTLEKGDLFQASQQLGILVNEPDLSSYCLSAFDYYQEVKDEINYEKQFSLGNLWHHYLLCKVGINGINDFYHADGMLPENIHLKYTHIRRQELIATSIVGHKTMGEDKLDQFPTSLHPSSFELRSPEIQMSFNKDLIDEVYNADLVIIPNGSVANWLPLVNANIELMRDVSARGKLVLMGNLFYTSNELPLQNYLEYLYLKDIFPRTLLPQEGWYTKLKTLIGEYARESKIPQSLESIKQAHEYYLNRIPQYKALVEKNQSGLEQCLEVEQQTGVKFTYESVSKSIMHCMNAKTRHFIFEKEKAKQVNYQS